jgi:hypothetical protein
MNYEEIMDVIKSKMSISEFAHHDFGRSNGKGGQFIDGVGECDEVDQHGGEGQGESWHSVKFFPDHDIYVKVYGYYSSYNGVDFYDGWSCCFEVKPKEKTIIVYKKVQ